MGICQMFLLQICFNITLKNKMDISTWSDLFTSPDWVNQQFLTALVTEQG